VITYCYTNVALNVDGPEGADMALRNAEGEIIFSVEML
jgi:hypothetical protein